MRKKALSPAHRRAAAQQVVKGGMCSARAACRILRVARSTYSYQGRPPTHAEQGLRKLSEKHPRYGYRRIAVVLRREGWAVGRRHIQRLGRQEGLRVPPTRRKSVRRGLSTGLPTHATHRNHVWTWGFIADATVRGGTLRILTILDEHTRECHVLRVDRALRSQDVLQADFHPPITHALLPHGVSQKTFSAKPCSFDGWTGGLRGAAARPTCRRLMTWSNHHKVVLGPSRLGGGRRLSALEGAPLPTKMIWPEIQSGPTHRRFRWPAGGTPRACQLEQIPAPHDLGSRYPRWPA